VQPYPDLSGKSGVTGYELGPDYILVEFRTGKRYRYSHARAGQVHVERMKRLAVAGRGLSCYIGKYCHDLNDRENVVQTNEVLQDETR
jgi:hypothetical protein